MNAGKIHQKVKETETKTLNLYKNQENKDNVEENKNFSKLIERFISF